MTTTTMGHASLAGKRIVTVEDEGITQLQLRRLLTKAGLKVVGQASNGMEGVEIVLREQPDIVLMDITMPVMNGLEATRTILEQLSTCIIMLTAYTHEDYREQARLNGAHGFLTKPVSGETLIKALEGIYADKCSNLGDD